MKLRDFINIKKQEEAGIHPIVESDVAPIEEYSAVVDIVTKFASQRDVIINNSKITTLGDFFKIIGDQDLDLSSNNLKITRLYNLKSLGDMVPPSFSEIEISACGLTDPNIIVMCDMFTISECHDLKSMDIGGHANSYIVSDCDGVESIRVESYAEALLTVSKCRNLIKVDCGKDYIDELTISDCKQLTELKNITGDINALIFEQDNGLPAKMDFTDIDKVLSVKSIVIQGDISHTEFEGLGSLLQINGLKSIQVDGLENEFEQVFKEPNYRKRVMMATQILDRHNVKHSI